MKIPHSSLGALRFCRRKSNPQSKDTKAGGNGKPPAFRSVNLPVECATQGPFNRQSASAEHCKNQRLAKAVCSELVNGMARPEIEFEQENDGRWIAEITALPSLMCYGKSQEEARRKVEALALRLFADRLKKMRIYPRSEDSAGKAV